MKYYLNITMVVAALACQACAPGDCPPQTLRVANQCVDIDDPRCDSPTGLYRDRDGDGYGTTEEVRAGCAIQGFATQDGDCDDDDRLVNPGAPELCNARDDDCNGAVDDDPEVVQWFVDADDDGFGEPGVPIESCDPIEGRATNALDCDDGTRQINPSQVETCDGRDEDCSGTADDGPTMECVFGETTECTTLCGSTGAATCSLTCEAGFCVPPLETCNGVDDDCDGLVDQELAEPIHLSTVALPPLGDGDTIESLDVVATDTGLAAFLVVLRRAAKRVDIFVLEFSGDGLLERGPSLVAGGAFVVDLYKPRTQVVADAQYYYVLVPPTEAGASLRRIRRSDLSLAGLESRSPVTTGIFTGQCLARVGDTLVWGRRRAAFELGPLLDQDLRANELEVEFLGTDLTPSDTYQYIPAGNDGTRDGSCGIVGVQGKPSQFFVAFDADPNIEALLVERSSGPLLGFTESFGVAGLDDSRAFFVDRARDGSFIVGQGNSQWYLGRFQVQVGLERVERNLNFGGLDDTLGGAGAVIDGRLILSGSRLDVLLAESLQGVQSFVAQGIAGIVERQGSPFLFSINTNTVELTVEVLGCPP